MKILHYIPELSEQLGAQYKMMLRVITATSSQTEAYLVTSTPLTQASVEQIQQAWHVRVVLLPKLSMGGPLAYYKARKAMKNVLATIQPDIVHIHGSWNPLLTLMERLAHGDGYVTTVSIYGAMAQEILYIDFVKKRLLPLLCYQIPLIRHASSLIAINEKEWKDINALNLKKKVEILHMDDSSLNSNLSALTSQLLAAYQKAIDSSFRRYLTAEEESFVEKCFIVATAEDPQHSTFNIQHSTLNTRRVFFLAYDEDIMPQLLEGSSRLGVVIPQPPQVETIPRYKDRKAKRRGAIRDLPLPHRRLRIPDANVDEYQVVASILRVQKEGLDRLTYRHKAELYQLFRNLDFNEDMVGHELSRLHLKGFTKKIQKLLKEMYNLPQGYNIF